MPLLVLNIFYRNTRWGHRRLHVHVISASSKHSMDSMALFFSVQLQQLNKRKTLICGNKTINGL